MKILFGSKVILNGSPILISEWLANKAVVGELSFPKDATIIEGDWSTAIPSECSVVDLNTLADMVKNLQKTYLINQIRKLKRPTEILKLVYKIKDESIVGHPFYRIVEVPIRLSIPYDHMKSVISKGNGLATSLNWDAEFPNIFLEVYATKKDKTTGKMVRIVPEIFKGIQMRYESAYDRNGNAMKPKTTYYTFEGERLDHSPLKDLEVGTVTTPSRAASPVKNIYIEKIISLSNKSTD